MGALRAGFARALEGATGACGLEARARARAARRAATAGRALKQTGRSRAARAPQEFKACYQHIPAKYHASMFDVYCQARGGHGAPRHATPPL